jgi:dinuclear metal center YbgI/SA1388 family protein
MPIPVRDALVALDTLAPPHLALGDDPRGLLVGDRDAPVTVIAVALDITPAVAAAARADGAQLAIAHHPLIYRPLRSLCADDPFPAAVVRACLEAHIAVACAHTNWDIASGGVNDILAQRLGLIDTRPLRITPHERADTGAAFGLGRIGTLAQPCDTAAFLARIEAELGTEVRTLHAPDRSIETVAVGGGACAELAIDARRAGADALVTSDIRHHEFIDALADDFLLLDAGHAATETPGAAELARRLAVLLPEVTVRFYGSDGRPW